MITRYTNYWVFNASQRKFEKFDVYTQGNLIIHIGDEVIPYDVLSDGLGKYMIPGLIDSHMHIESSMTTPQEFSKTVLKFGTTTILADAHEVANVFGYEGLEEYMSQETHLDIFYAIPSSVPSTNPRLETTGGIVDEVVVKKLARNPRVIALGEIMNFKDLTSDDDTLTKRIIESYKIIQPSGLIEGHIPRIGGLGLSKFLRQGIGSDHTQQTVDSLLEKTRSGLMVQLQQKSLSKEIIKAIYDFNLFNSVCLVTDDVMPDDLVNHGYLNHLVKLVCEMGMRFEDAVFIASTNPSKHLNLRDRGVIAPGKIADLVIVDSLDRLKIVKVIKSGVDVNTLKEGEFVVSNPKHLKSIQREKLMPEDFLITSSKSEENVRIMVREKGSTFTIEDFQRVSVTHGVLDWEKAGLNLICVVERYGKQSKLEFGFCKNGFDKPCAIATSWAHDHHNILVMGNSVSMIVDVVNEVITKQGGISIITEHDSEWVPLAYGGIVSLEPMQILAPKVEKVRSLMRESGYLSHNELMSFAVLSLLVSPNLKISDKGYVDVMTQEIKGWSA